MEELEQTTQTTRRGPRPRGRPSTKRGRLAAAKPEGWPRRVRRCFAQGRVVYTRHARKRMAERGIEGRHLMKAAKSSELVGKGFGSTVILRGRRKKGRRLVLVCSYEPDRDVVVLVTVYEPGAWP